MPDADPAEIIRSIWAGNLGVDEVADRDSFFQLGGDSMLAVESCVAIAESLGAADRVDELLTILYDHPLFGEFCTLASREFKRA